MSQNRNALIMGVPYKASLLRPRCLNRIGLTVTLPHADPLFQAKRQVLQQNNLATQQTFQLKQGQVRTQAACILCPASCRGAALLRVFQLCATCSASAAAGDNRDMLTRFAAGSCSGRNKGLGRP